MKRMNNVLIVYSSKYGATKQAAHSLAQQLGEKARLHNLDKGNPNMSDVDTVVVGGPIYAGMLLKPVKQFCSGNQQQLLDKKLYLFICCSSPDETDKFFNENFPQPLLQHASGKYCFGGRLPSGNVKMMDRMIISMVAKKLKGPSPQIDSDAIGQLASQLV